MAWCRSCERYLTPATLTAEGSCPTCGSEVQHPAATPSGPAGAPTDRIPWHFWLLVGAAAVYLGWRAVQGVALLLALPGVAGPV